MSICVVTDSTSDLPAELAADLGITIVPAYITFSGKTYRDGIDISQDELYHRMVELDQTATTSQPPPSDFSDCYRHLLKTYDAIVSIHATRKLSGIYSSALQAKQIATDRIRVIDSQSASMGLGLLAILAARLCRAGQEFEQIVQEVCDNIGSTHTYAIFDTLKYLQRGGRIGKAKALLGSVLKIKPLLAMRAGEIHPLSVARTRAMAIEKLVQTFTGHTEVPEIGIVHSTTLQDAINLKDRLSLLFQQSQVHISRLGPALGVHGGPGTLVLAFREKAGAIRGYAKNGAVDKKLPGLPSLPDIKLPRLRFAGT